MCRRPFVLHPVCTGAALDSAGRSPLFHFIMIKHKRPPLPLLFPPPDNSPFINSRGRKRPDDPENNNGLIIGGHALRLSPALPARLPALSMLPVSQMSVSACAVACSIGLDYGSGGGTVGIDRVVKSAKL